MLKNEGFRKIISITLVLALVIINCIFSGFDTNAVRAETQVTYFVSPTGSDTNDGSLSHPFQTIIEARDVVRTINSSMTGDIIVNLMGGTYSLSSSITFNLSKENPAVRSQHCPPPPKAYETHG